MIEVKTNSGFECQLDDEALNDWELMEYLTEMDQGDFSHIVLVEKHLLGDEQSKKLREHVRGEDGRVKADQMVTELTEILTSTQELKN